MIQIYKYNDYDVESAGFMYSFFNRIWKIPAEFQMVVSKRERVEEPGQKKNGNNEGYGIDN